MNSEDMWSSHIAGKKHIKKVRSGPRVIYKRKIEDELDDYDMHPKFSRYDDDSNSYGGWSDSHPEDQRDSSHIYDARDSLYNEGQKRNFPNKSKQPLLDTPNTRSSSNPLDCDDPFERRKDADPYDLKYGTIRDYGHKSADLSPKSDDKELYEWRKERDINSSSRSRIPEAPGFRDDRKTSFSDSLKPTSGVSPLKPSLKMPSIIASPLMPPLKSVSAVPPLKPPPKMPSIIASPLVPPLEPPPGLPPLKPPPGLPPLKPSSQPEMTDKYANSQPLFEDVVSQMFQCNSSAHENSFNNGSYGKLNDNFQWKSDLLPKDKPGDFFSSLPSEISPQSSRAPIIETPNISAISFTTQMIQSILSGINEDQLCSPKPVSSVNVDQQKIKSISETTFEKFANQLAKLKQSVAHQKPVVTNDKTTNKGYEFLDILNRYNEDSLFDDIYGPDIDEEKSNSSSKPSSSKKLSSEKISSKRKISSETVSTEKISLEKVDSKLKTIDPDNLTHDVLDDLLSAYLKPKSKRTTSEKTTSERTKSERPTSERSRSEKSTSERSKSERSRYERPTSERLKSDRPKLERPKSEITGVRKEQNDSPEEIAQKVESLPTKSFLQIVLKKVERIELKDWEEINMLSNIIVKAQAAVCSKLPPHLQSAIKQKMSSSNSKKIPITYENAENSQSSTLPSQRKPSANSQGSALPPQREAPANLRSSTLPPQRETPVNQPTHIVLNKAVASTCSSPESGKKAESGDNPLDHKSVYRQILLSLYRKAFSSSSATNSSTTVTQSQSSAIPQTVTYNDLKSSILLNGLSNLESLRKQSQSSHPVPHAAGSHRLLVNQNISGSPSGQSSSSSSQNILSKLVHSSNKMQTQLKQPTSKSTTKEWEDFFTK